MHLLPVSFHRIHGPPPCFPAYYVYSGMFGVCISCSLGCSTSCLVFVTKRRWRKRFQTSAHFTGLFLLLPCSSYLERTPPWAWCTTFPRPNWLFVTTRPLELVNWELGWFRSSFIPLILSLLSWVWRRDTWSTRSGRLLGPCWRSSLSFSRFAQLFPSSWTDWCGLSFLVSRSPGTIRWRTCVVSSGVASGCR